MFFPRSDPDGSLPSSLLSFLWLFFALCNFRDSLEGALSLKSLRFPSPLIFSGCSLSRQTFFYVGAAGLLFVFGSPGGLLCSRYPHFPDFFCRFFTGGIICISNWSYSCVFSFCFFFLLLIFLISFWSSLESAFVRQLPAFFF